METKTQTDASSRREVLLETMEAIVDRAESDGSRAFDDNEARLLNALIDREAEATREAEGDRTPVPRLIQPSPIGGENRNPATTAGRGDNMNDSEKRIETWQTTDGTTVHRFDREQRMADVCAMPEEYAEIEHPIGELVRGAVTGRWHPAFAERRAMSEAVPHLGGISVPDFVSAAFYDRARARSIAITLGATTVTWDGSDTLTYARITDDPTVALVGENAAITPSDTSLDGLKFVADKYGALVKCSRELFDDSPNIAQIVETSLAQAMAVSIDQLVLAKVLAGATSDQAVDGGIEWEDLAIAVEAIALLEHVATGYCVNPAIAHDLSIITSGDGANSAKLWKGPPPSVAGLMAESSTSVALATPLVGDWSKAVLGVRQSTQIALSEHAGASFAANQVWIRLIWRGCVRLAYPDAFCTLSGVTS